MISRSLIEDAMSEKLSQLGETSASDLQLDGQPSQGKKTKIVLAASCPRTWSGLGKLVFVHVPLGSWFAESSVWRKMILEGPKTSLAEISTN